jgi:putative RNA 2'-phosphotransferase
MINQEYSKKLSWILRHKAKKLGLDVCKMGWVQVSELLKYIHISKGELGELVLKDRKQRFEFQDESQQMIRACQGHSMTHMQKTDDLETSWTLYPLTEGIVWHGTNFEAAKIIAQEGIKAQSRTHVHLASELNSTVGKRAQVSFMLGINIGQLLQSGQQIYQSSNGVLLVRYIPVNCITEIKAMTKKAHKQIEELLSLYQ